MDIVTAKLMIATAIFFISLFSSIAPLKVIGMSDQLFSMGNLLASGVLLAAGLVHQLPDAIESLDGSFPSSTIAGDDFPVASFIAGLTFCAFLIFEEFMHTEFSQDLPFHSHGSTGKPSSPRPSSPSKKSFHEDGETDGGGVGGGRGLTSHAHSHDHAHSHGHSHRHQQQQHQHQQQHTGHTEEQIEEEIQKLLMLKNDVHNKTKKRSSVTFRSASISYINAGIIIDGKDEERDFVESDHNHHHHRHTDDDQRNSSLAACNITSQSSSHSHEQKNETTKLLTQATRLSTFGLDLANVGSSLISTASVHSVPRRCGEDPTGMISIRKSSRPTILESFRDQTFELEHPVHHHDDHLANHMHGSLLASLILLCALSVHSIFDGMSIGIGRTMSDVVGSTAAVLAHKAFAGYALGSAMVASEMKERHFLVLCVAFSLCSIAGIFLGMIFEQLSDADDSTPTGIIQAMVAGTFLYVSIVEIGMKELMLHRESSTSHQMGDSVTMNVRTMEYSKLFCFLFGYLLMSFLAIWV